MPHYDGILNLLKPPGMTSHDAVAFVRRVFGLRRVGHTGTLDPAACGVLPIVLGKATRVAPYLQAQFKTYRAEMTLGVTTDTHDQLGQTLQVVSDFTVTPAALGEVLASFLGDYAQVPPMTSARRHRGKRLYELARRGEEVQRPARVVRVQRLHIVRVIPDDPYGLGFGTRVLFDVTCSSGTYVRTLCHDIGQRLGCGAHMSFLIRTRAGPFDIQDAVTCQQVEELAASRRLSELLLPMEAGLQHLPAVSVATGDDRRFCQGQSVPCRWLPLPAGDESPALEGNGAGDMDLARVHGPTGALLGLGRVSVQRGKTWVHPQRVLGSDDGSGS